MKEPSWHPFTTIQVDEEDKVFIQFPYRIRALPFSEFLVKNHWPFGSNIFDFWTITGGYR